MKEIKIIQPFWLWKQLLFSKASIKYSIIFGVLFLLYYIIKLFYTGNFIVASIIWATSESTDYYIP